MMPENDTTNESITVEEAQCFIDQLRVESGGMTKEDRTDLLRDKPHLVAMFDNMRKKLGAATETLATNLYSKSTRFIYELVQNAEDNHYSYTRTQPRRPWLSFSLYPNRVVIDSNEDGFTKEDIKALCSVNESNKKKVQGYVGEKGIGFKSVFRVARKVHVQSGPFSFYFEYERGGKDSGLGMVTPFNHDLLEVPAGTRTRITLYLLESCNVQSLRTQFAELPHTLLLFLNKLKSLSIHIHLPGQDDVDKRYSLSAFGNRASINVSFKKPQASCTYNYWVVRRRVGGLPHDDARKGVHEAEVVLAFPLNAMDTPVVQSQDVYAFLPLRKIGYKFLIQSDFITQASREDVFDSEWNRQLLEEAAETFFAGVDGFLGHPTLKYHWIRYIPVDEIADDFWGELRSKILNTLSKRDVFFSRPLSPLATELTRLVGNLRIPGKDYKDSLGSPLLPDYANSVTGYVSDGYNEDPDLPILRKLGSKQMVMADFLERLKKDLEVSSRFNNRNGVNWSWTDSWHLQVVQNLITATSDPIHLAQLEILPVVPLQSGNVVPPLHGSIFFPTSGGAQIPPGLSLSLIHDFVSQNETWRQLLEQLGVTECHADRVVPLITQRYSNSVRLDLSHSLLDIKFFFWHHDRVPETNTSMQVATEQDGGWVNPTIPRPSWIYYRRAEESYSAIKLLTDPSRSPSAAWKMFTFPLEQYYENLEQCEPRNGVKGVEWFRIFFQLKDTPQLVSRANDTCISSEVKHVAKYLPHCLLKVLKTSSPQDLKRCIWFFRVTEVPVLFSRQSKKLEATWLPLQRLIDIATDLSLEKDVGFLQEPGELSGTSTEEWRFLSQLGVGVEEGIEFWLRLLNLAQAEKAVKKETVFRIYSQIQNYNQPTESELVRETFRNYSYVCKPSTDSVESVSWDNLGSCVWSGPDWFTFKHRLASIEAYQNLYGLFHNTLAVKSAGYEDFLLYLQHIKNSKSYANLADEEGKITLLYEKLGHEIIGNVEREDDIRSQRRAYPVTLLTMSFGSLKKIEVYANANRITFEEEELVYIPTSKSWQSPSNCVWAGDRIQLPGKASITSLYANRESFFLDILKIPKPSLEMHVISLMQKVTERHDKTEIFKEILNICALSPTAEVLNQLSDCRCLPIKSASGDVQWHDRNAKFGIVDRRDYGNAFKGKINVLDFSVEEVHSSNSFLIELGLAGRYLSSAVSETSTVEEGTKDERLTADLRKKAYAICRYAAHMGSQITKDQPLAVFHKLGGVEVFLSDGISQVLSVTGMGVLESGQSPTIPIDFADFHLAEQGGKLSLYVPKDRRRQRACLARKLPMSLLKYLGAKPLNSAGELGSIITESDLSIADDLLEQAGIIELPGIQRPEDTELPVIQRSEDNTLPGIQKAEDFELPTIQRPEVNSGYGTDTPWSDSRSKIAAITTPTRLTPRQGNTYFDSSPRPSFLDTNQSDPSPTPVPSISSPHPSEQQRLYEKLLNAVIRQATELSRLPPVGQILQASASNSSGLNVSLAVDAPTQFERDKYIGAAGELFVFGLLENLKLPGFGLDEWQSTIRHRVAAHENYRNLTRWARKETADIVYHDQTSRLTEILIRGGYLNGSIWQGRCPRYYFEVKTTTGFLESLFYCSHSQYERMNQMKLRAGEAADEVYLIARVFKLGDAGMGLKLYLDPATLEKEGKLRFKSDKYSITPVGAPIFVFGQGQTVSGSQFGFGVSVSQ